MLKLAEDGLKSNISLALAQLDRLQQSFRGCPSSGSGEVRESAAMGNYGLNNLAYLKTDWAGTRWGERQIQLVLKHILPQLTRYSPGGARSAVVLGAGTGRYAVECARHCCLVIAVEFCYSYVDLFLELQKGPISFWELNFGRPVSTGTMVMGYVASLPSDPVLLSRVHYVIADATTLPLPSESQSTAISIYLMDVLPVRTLLLEVRRVLRPGGILIHFGPLLYHYNTLSELLAPEEVLKVAEEYGFAVVEEKWMQMPFFRNENRGAYAVHRVWSLVLRRH
jgi:carnosine N-methyltransferase